MIGLQWVAEVRRMFPRCVYCGQDISVTPLAELVKVADRDRLAHRECPEVKDVA